MSLEVLIRLNVSVDCVWKNVAKMYLSRSSGFAVFSENDEIRHSLNILQACYLVKCLVLLFFVSWKPSGTKLI